MDCCVDIVRSFEPDRFETEEEFLVWARQVARNNVRDAARREAAYEAEIAAWETNAVALAAALNSQKGETIALNRRRGWADDLEPALFDNGIDRITLDAMTAEVVDSLPDFHRFFEAKATLLGYGDTLPWSGLVAPVSEDGAGFDWTDATTRVVDAFGHYGEPLRALASRAIVTGA